MATPESGLPSRGVASGGGGFVTRIPDIYSKYEWILFVGLGVLQLVPIWSVHFFATLDGPLHVSNMLAYLRMDEPGYEILRDLYQPAHNIAPTISSTSSSMAPFNFLAHWFRRNCFCRSMCWRFRWLSATHLAPWAGTPPCSRPSGFRWRIRWSFFLVSTTHHLPWSHFFLPSDTGFDTGTRQAGGYFWFILFWPCFVFSSTGPPSC